MATDAHVIVEGLGHFKDIESLLAAMENDFCLMIMLMKLSMRFKLMLYVKFIALIVK